MTDAPKANPDEFNLDQSNPEAPNPDAPNPDKIDQMNFEQLLEASFKETGKQDLNPGDMVEGTIISIGKTHIYVDTGTKSDGVAEISELLDGQGEFLYNVGDMIKLYVVSRTESEIILSKAISGAGKEMIMEDAFRAGTPVEGKVAEVIKGGFSVNILGKRAFCPISQMDVRYVEEQEPYLNQTFLFLITRFEENGRNIVVSRRELLLAEMKEAQEEFLSRTAAGDIVQGKVTRLANYGAFVEIAPGLEGMAHISELSWSRVENPGDILHLGDEISVKILQMEPGEKGMKISLSMKQVSDNPWNSIDSLFHVGDHVQGTVVRLAPFGAFVEIAPGVDGLVHISEMSYTKRITRPEDVVEQGQNIQVAIKEIDRENQRISLSMKDASEDPWTGASAKYPAGTTVQGIFEKKETFGLFIQVEPGVTGLLPRSVLKESSNAKIYESAKPGAAVEIVVQEVDEDNRRMSLTTKDQYEKAQQDPDAWKQFAPAKKQKPMGTMESVLRKAMEENAKRK